MVSFNFFKFLRLGTPNKIEDIAYAKAFKLKHLELKRKL